MPNTKSKKFDFSILLASLSIVLVICCAVVCCVIGIGADNQVAQAYTSEEIGVSNFEFTVNTGFYIRGYDSVESDINSLINYYFYYTGYEDSEDFNYSYQCGTLYYLITNTDGLSVAYGCPLFLELSKNSDSNLLHLALLLSETNDLYFFELYYNYVDNSLDDFYIGITNTQSPNRPYNYYITFVNHPQSIGTFANDFIMATLGEDELEYVYSIDEFNFVFNNTTNIGCFISPNQSFATPPIIMPDSVFNDFSNEKYDEGYFDGYDDGVQDLDYYESVINQLREELAYYRSLDLNYQEIQVFNIARCKPSTFVYDGVTYTSNSIVRTNDGWDIYSSTYLNEELPDNYGVGFSLFLEETISNSKFHIYPDIISWYNYTYCSPPAQDGSQECYQVNQRNTDFSVGYRTQNGNIVKIGEFSNSPGMSTGNFVINQPTNEIVFFREDSNLMQLGNAFSLITYQFDTETIYNDGYENGKTQGIQIGRQEGYNQGVLDANDYSFFSLFTSVFDAPISAIVGKWGDSDGDGVYQREGGMLNFYIPGLDINFAPFLLSLFTIAIIVLVIRFIMARKS